MSTSDVQESYLAWARTTSSPRPWAGCATAGLVRPCLRCLHWEGVHPQQGRVPRLARTPSSPPLAPCRMCHGRSCPAVPSLRQPPQESPGGTRPARAHFCSLRPRIHLEQGIFITGPEARARPYPVGGLGNQTPSDRIGMDVFGHLHQAFQLGNVLVKSTTGLPETKDRPGAVFDCQSLEPSSLAGLLKVPLRLLADRSLQVV